MDDFTKKVYEMRGSSGGFGKMLARGGVGLILLILLVAGCSSVHIVPAGHRGVKFNILSGLVPIAYGEGLAMKIPFVETFIDIDVRIDKIEHQASAASKDLQTVNTTVALNFRPDPEKVMAIYQSIGLAYRQRVIDPAIQEAVKSVTAQYTAEELITRREEVKSKIQSVLDEKLRPENIIVVAVNLTDFQFSEVFASAIEQKQTAEQLALKAKRDLDRIRIEAEQRVAQAKAEAEAQRMLAQSITPQVVELRRIDAFQDAIRKWNGQMPQVSSGALPFWDVLGNARPPREGH